MRRFRLVPTVAIALGALSLTACGDSVECGWKDGGIYVPCPGETTTSVRPATTTTAVTSTTTRTTPSTTTPPYTQTVRETTVIVVTPTTTTATPTTTPTSTVTPTPSAPPAYTPPPAPTQYVYADTSRVIDCGGLLVLDGESVSGNDGTRVTRSGGMLSFNAAPTYPITNVILGEFSGYPVGITNANIGTRPGQSLSFITNYSGAVTLCDS